MATKVLIVDDHQLLREGLRSLLDKRDDIEVVGEAADGATAIQLARELRPDVILMDVSMPDMDGIDTTHQISQDMPDTKILALSTYPEKRLVTKMLRAGACGYILKQNAFDVVEEAIGRVMTGENYLCSEIAGLLAEDYMKGGVSALTDKELDVLRLVAEGKSSKQIAIVMDLSSKSIDTYRRRIMQKLGVDNIADLIKFAIREGLTSLGDEAHS